MSARKSARCRLGSAHVGFLHIGADVGLHETDVGSDAEYWAATSARCAVLPNRCRQTLMRLTKALAQKRRCCCTCRLRCRPTWMRCRVRLSHLSGSGKSRIRCRPMWNGMGEPTMLLHKSAPMSADAEPMSDRCEDCFKKVGSDVGRHGTYDRSM